VLSAVAVRASTGTPTGTKHTVIGTFALSWISEGLAENQNMKYTFNYFKNNTLNYVASLQSDRRVDSFPKALLIATSCLPLLDLDLDLKTSKIFSLRVSTTIVNNKYLSDTNTKSVYLLTDQVSTVAFIYHNRGACEDQ